MNPLRIVLFALAFMLGCTPLGAEQGRYLDANGTRIYYEVEGSGEPLVLIHGFTLNLRMWDPQVADFARAYQVIRIDRRGFGRSSGAEDITWDPEDLRAVLDALGVKQAHVLGMSQGAAVALMFTIAYPDRVRSLILNGANAPEGFGLPAIGADRLVHGEFEAIARKDGLDAARQAWAKHPLLEIPPGHAGARKLMDDLLAAYRGGRWLNPVAPSGPSKPAAMADLAGLNVPTLILVGDRELAYRRIVADVLTYGIPGARKVVVPGGGHMVNIIAPRPYNRAVLDFLASLRR